MLVGFLCLLGGAPALELALTERQPTGLACGDLDPEHRSARWLSLSGCRLSWAEAGYATVGKSVTEVYVPVRADAEEASAPVRFVLASRGAEHLRLGEALWAAHGDPAGMQEALTAHRATTAKADELRGVWRELGELSAEEREVLRGLPVSLGTKVGVLDDGATPDLGTGLVLCLVAVICAVIAARGLRRRRQWRRPDGATG